MTYVRGMSSRNPWSRPIDYNRVIAADERMIALCERAIFGHWFPINGYDSLLTLPFLEASIAEDLGLTGEDLDCLAAYCDFRGDLQAHANRGGDIVGWHRRGHAIAERLCALSGGGDSARIKTEIGWRDMLKAARSSLARHRRNQAKFGR